MPFFEDEILSRLAAQNELALGQLAIVPVSGLRIARPFNFLHPQGPPPTGPAGAFMAFSKDAAHPPACMHKRIDFLTH